jgi:2,4-dienoyl-CoA reductase-like NADH-dependent reductase (Old Yellow Enzyme family)
MRPWEIVSFTFTPSGPKGGAGLIIIPFSPVAIGASVDPGLYDDRFLPDIQRLTSTLRSHGAKSACQLIITYHLIVRDQRPEVIGPSAVLNQMLRVVPREITQKEIGFIVHEKDRISSEKLKNPKRFLL